MQVLGCKKYKTNHPQETPQQLKKYQEVTLSSLLNNTYTLQVSQSYRIETKAFPLRIHESIKSCSVH